MKMIRYSIMCMALLAVSAAITPLQNVRADNTITVNTPAELGAQDTKDRSSYNTALTQLNSFMRHKQVIPSYEDTVDHFLIYKNEVSRQEIGETIFHMYSKVGPRPVKKYFGDREIAAEKAAALKVQQTTQAQAAAAAAAQAQAQAAAKAKAAAVVPTPTPTYSTPSSGARTGAICKDGTPSSATGSGACSHHGGVDHWLY
jgi:hypothetical protein